MYLFGYVFDRSNWRRLCCFLNDDVLSELLIYELQFPISILVKGLQVAKDSSPYRWGCSGSVCVEQLHEACAKQTSHEYPNNQNTSDQWDPLNACLHIPWGHPPIVCPRELLKNAKVSSSSMQQEPKWNVVLRFTVKPNPEGPQALLLPAPGSKGQGGTLSQHHSGSGGSRLIP